MHHTFLYISLPFLQDYDVKMANFAFHGERKQATTEFHFSFWTVGMVPWNQLQEGSPACEVSGWVGIIATKTERITQIHFRGVVLVAVASLDLRRQRKRHFENEFAFFKLCQVYSTSPKNVKCARVSLGLIPWGPYLRKERKIRRRFFASSLKREIRHFHVAIVHSDGKEMTYRKAWFTCQVILLV